MEKQMDLIEASKFYGSYQALFDETRELLCEEVELTHIAEEILTCSAISTSVQ